MRKIFINCEVLCKFKKWPSLIWNPVHKKDIVLWEPLPSSNWRRLYEEAHNHPPLFWGIGLNWLGSKRRLSLWHQRDGGWRHKSCGSEKLLKERERENSSIRMLIYHTSDFPVNKVTLCKQLNFSQLASLGEGHPLIDPNHMGCWTRVNCHHQKNYMWLSPAPESHWDWEGGGRIFSQAPSWAEQQTWS